ncbi:RsfA family transcriptional regulator [Brevibacillus ginsengisoli]|uniref:RsfA family transcriptional regulator n=1 Tax=Brevibacillus ginsengisoli TaxID=363854 RepID=UPI003CEA9EC9
MVASRQDAWTDDDDLVLAEVTLRLIREGGTQLAAFEEVGQRLGRTAAACGFRWNSAVRKRYEAAIAIAKSQRQQLKKAGRIQVLAEMATEDFHEMNVNPTPLPQVTTPTPTIAQPPTVGQDEEQLDQAIRTLMKYKDVVRRLKQLERDLEHKETELRALQEVNFKMKKELDSVQGVNDDYKALLQIMDRARKLAFLKEEEPSKPVFKMDANGNLERVE